MLKGLEVTVDGLYSRPEFGQIARSESSDSPWKIMGSNALISAIGLLFLSWLNPSSGSPVQSCLHRLSDGSVIYIGENTNFATTMLHGPLHLQYAIKIPPQSGKTHSEEPLPLLNMFPASAATRWQLYRNIAPGRGSGVFFNPHPPLNGVSTPVQQLHPLFWYIPTHPIIPLDQRRPGQLKQAPSKFVNVHYHSNVDMNRQEDLLI